MEIEFVNSRIKTIAEKHSKAIKKYGKERADKIMIRLNELKAAETLLDIKNLPQTELEPLKYERSGQFSIKTVKQYRIIIEPIGDYEINKLNTIKKVKILNLDLDYHKRK